MYRGCAARCGKTAMPETCTAGRGAGHVGWHRVAAARCGLLQTARFGKRLTNEWRRIETWTAWEQHGAEWLPVRYGVALHSAKQLPKNPQTLARQGV
jgi:hypothetical protein